MKVSWDSEMGFRFERASPALKETLLGMRRSGRPPVVDHNIHEFGSVEYRIQSSVSDPYNAYLSLRMPGVRGGSRLNEELSELVYDMAKKCRYKACEIVEPATEGYEITLMIHLTKIPQKRELQIVSKIASVPALVLSSELKELLSVKSQNVIRGGTCKPLKLAYHPSQSFFVIRHPCKILIVFPMRFKEDADVHIATTFFQELVDEGCSEKWAKAPQCHWSPIPPAELRGELLKDLNTNAGFISFDIYPQHLEGKKLDNVTWTLQMFHAYIHYHITSTKCFIQRRMKMRMKSLLQCRFCTKLKIKNTNLFKSFKDPRLSGSCPNSINLALAKKGGAFVKTEKYQEAFFPS